MTSKEYIEDIIKRIEKFIEKYNDCNEHIKSQLEHYKQVLKDLEILEIIKKWSFLDTFYREDTDTTYDRFLCNIHTKGMKEDFKKVKEWLDGK